MSCIPRPWEAGRHVIQLQMYQEVDTEQVPEQVEQQTPVIRVQTPVMSGLKTRDWLRRLVVAMAPEAEPAAGMLQEPMQLDNVSMENEADKCFHTDEHAHKRDQRVQKYKIMALQRRFAELSAQVETAVLEVRALLLWGADSAASALKQEPCGHMHMHHATWVSKPCTFENIVHTHGLACACMHAPVHAKALLHHHSESRCSTVWSDSQDTVVLHARCGVFAFPEFSGINAQ